MDRDKIYIDNTGITDAGSGTPESGSFQYTSGPNPGQFVTSYDEPAVTNPVFFCL